jgi:hypothetical protein
METLHVYSQDAWHDDVTIVGTVESLEQLKIAIDKAIQSGYSRIDLFCNDGEGYCLRVVEMTENDIERVPVPYKADYACPPYQETSDFMGKLHRMYPSNPSRVNYENWHRGI